MSRLQPELKKLQQKHKGDRERLNKEMLAFYQEHKINPLAGCLPLLLQMPIFIVLYRVIDGLGRAQERLAAGAPESLARLACSSDKLAGETCVKGPKYLDSDTALYESLARTVGETKDAGIEMVSFGIDLTNSLSKAWSESIVEALPFLFLVGLVAITGYVQQRQISARGTAAAANPQQQMMTRLMPGFFALISITIPAGVVLYFIVSNGVRIGQQWLVTRLETRPAAKGPAAAAGDGKSRERAQADESEPEVGDSPPTREQPGGRSPAGEGTPRPRKRRKKRR